MGRRGDHFRLKVTSRHPDLLAAAAAAALSVTGAIVAQELWRITPTVPLAYIADGQLFLGIIKATVEHGWYLNNPDLGAPLGSDWYDYPVASGDTLQLLLIRALSVFSGNYVVVLHLFYVLGYALTAISAFAVLRLLGISRGPAVVCATLYSLLPFHLALNEAHPFHTAYWVVPIACFLVLAVLLDRPLFARRDGSHGRLAGFASRTTLATLGACVLIGSAGANYYSVFAAGLVVIAGLVAAILYDWRRSVATAGVVAAAILAVVALNGLPSLIYEAENGANGQVANRLPRGVRAVQPHALQPPRPLPWPPDRPPGRAAARLRGIEPDSGRRISTRDRHGGCNWLHLARRLRARVDSEAGAMAAAVEVARSRGNSNADLVLDRDDRWLLPAFRPPGLATASRLAALQLLHRLLRAPRGRLLAGHGNSPAAVGYPRQRCRRGPLVVILTLGFLDQTNPSYVPAYDDVRAEFGSDETFVTSIEQELEPNAAVFQLPYVPFPEWWPTSGTNAFDPFRGYLHSSDLRWSYGATTARPENWQPGVIDESASQLLARVSAAGFDGIVIDRWAYPDNAAKLESAIAETVAGKPVVAPNGRYSFFDLRTFGEELRRSYGEAIESLRSTTLSPLVAGPGLGLTRSVPPNGNYSPNLQMTGSSGQLSLVNPSDAARDAILELSVEPDAEVGVDVSLPNGSLEPVRPGEPLRESVSLPPGTTTLQLQATGEVGPGEIHVRLYDAGIEALKRPPGGVAVQP